MLKHFFQTLLLFCSRYFKLIITTCLAHLLLKVGAFNEALWVELAGIGAEDGRVYQCKSVLATQRVTLLDLCKKET